MTDPLDCPVTPDPVWDLSLAHGDDGYTAMTTVRPHGWIPIPEWGTRGVDLGRWPHVIVFVRARDDGFDLAEYVEGDVTQWRLDTRDQLDHALRAVARRWQEPAATTDWQAS